MKHTRFGLLIGFLLAVVLFALIAHTARAAPVTVTEWVVQIEGSPGVWTDYGDPVVYTDATSKSTTKVTASASAVANAGRLIKREITEDGTTKVTTDIVANLKSNPTFTVSAPMSQWIKFLKMEAGNSDPDMIALMIAVRAALGLQ